MNSKYRYINICKYQTIPIFNQPSWLDFASYKWDVFEICGSGSLKLYLPYVIKKKIYNYSSMPDLTQKFSIISNKEIVLDEKILTLISTNLQTLSDKFIYFNQTLSENFNQLKYTLNEKFITKHSKSYFINKNHINYKSEYSSNIKNLLNKAKKNKFFIIEDSIENFIVNYNLNLSRINKDNYYSEFFLFKLHEYINLNKCGKIFSVVDDANVSHASSMIIWDNNDVYMILLSSNKKLLSQGGSIFLIDELIRFAHSNNKNFDFEGSSIPKIEFFYSRFTKNYKKILEVKFFKNNLIKFLCKFK
tara:strand:+ start:1090 stop:2001 length:912 start_codon:yes stop_codon:yes gene_type:complete